jgi:hypothetical protein
MYRIRRQLFVGIMAVTLACVASARALAQPGGTGPTGPAPSGGAGAPQTPSRVAFTAESLPQMFKQLGYSVTEKSSNNGTHWQIVTQSENWNFTVNVLPMVNQGKITSLLLTSDLGKKVSPQAGAQDVLKLLQWNQEQGFMFYFGYNAQSACVTAQRPVNIPDASLEELRFVFDDFFKAIRTYHPVWNALSGAAPAPAANGGPAPNGKQPQPVEPQMNIVGTTWNGNENLPGFGKLTFAFRANGAATMIDAKGQTEGTWTQNGNDLTINFNGCVYQGRITGLTISGSGRLTAGAQTGQTWSFQVALQKN